MLEITDAANGTCIISVEFADHLLWTLCKAVTREERGTSGVSGNNYHSLRPWVRGSSVLAPCSCSSHCWLISSSLKQYIGRKLVSCRSDQTGGVSSFTTASPRVNTSTQGSSVVTSNLAASVRQLMVYDRMPDRCKTGLAATLPTFLVFSYSTACQRNTTTHPFQDHSFTSVRKGNSN